LDYRCNYRWRSRFASLRASLNSRTWPQQLNFIGRPPRAKAKAEMLAQQLDAPWSYFSHRLTALLRTDRRDKYDGEQRRAVGSI
jgi:hypothetical protein